MMKKIAHILLLAAICCAFAVPAMASEVVYLVDVYTFRDGTGKPYVEIHMNIDATTLYYAKKKNGKFQSGVEVLLALQAEGDAKKADVIKIDLLTPEVSDTATETLQQRLIDVRKFPLEPGKYTLTGFIQEKFNPEKQEMKFEREVIVEPVEADGFSFSDMMYTEEFRKSTKKKPYTRYGYDVVPQVSNDYFENRDELNFFVELYNTTALTDKEFFFLHSYITLANSPQKLEKYQQTTKRKTGKLDLVSQTFDISKLPSQTYYVHLELLAGGKKVASVSRKFYVFNDIEAGDFTTNYKTYDQVYGFTEKELDYLFRPMAFIATNTEGNFMGSLTTFEEKQNFFMNFWEKRKKRPTDPPNRAFEIFKAKIDYANEHYKSFYVEGWATDRGRVMIQYGQPHDIERFPAEPYRYPHEIWRYNKVGTQSNVMFVFYDPDLITGDYPLLHSDVLGENNNQRWKLELVNRRTQDGNIDSDEVGGRSQR